jgi:hypothetical protein
LAFSAAAVHEERYDEAAAWMVKCAEANPDLGGFLGAQAAYLALAGRMNEARSVCARALELEPGISIRTALSHGLAPAIEAKLVKGYRLLGFARELTTKPVRRRKSRGLAVNVGASSGAV